MNSLKSRSYSFNSRKGDEVLPITFIEGSITKTGAYITQEEADEIITVNQMRNGDAVVEMDAVKYLNKLNLDNIELTKYLFLLVKVA